MAAALPEHCLRKIFNSFNNLEYSISFKRSLVLINRYWCETLTPELWRDPFENCETSESYELLIDTYLKCLPSNVLKNLGLVTTSSSIAFDYPSYLRHFDPNVIFSAVKIWVEQTIRPDIDCVEKERRIVAIYCALLGNFMLKSKVIQKITLYETQLVNFYNFFGAETCLAAIETLNCNVSDVGAMELSNIIYSALTVSKNLQKLKICLLNIDVCIDSIIKNMSCLIKVQQNLKAISIESFEKDFRKLWKSISLHFNSLVDVRLVSIKFSERKPFKLQELAFIPNLEIIKIYNCENLEFTSSPKIDSIAFRKIHRFKVENCLKFPMSFIKTVLSRSNKTMREIGFRGLDKYVEIIELCIQYCTNITRIDLTIKRSQFSIFIELLEVCKDLQEIYIDDMIYVDEYTSLMGCKRKNSSEDGNEILKQLGKVLPRKVQSFIFYLDWWFTPKSLESFLENCAVKELRTLSFALYKEFSLKHLNVILKYCSGTLKNLHLNTNKHIPDGDLERARDMIEYIIFDGGEYIDDYRCYEGSDNEYYDDGYDIHYGAKIDEIYDDCEYEYYSDSDEFDDYDD
ncbi:207_t:CDS:1 [Scutellospora calospora]|uniref:207_t:CDS:1 n=1 Tax=Scutellospora calospora TaxID=85575 RepID=A0ACA9KRK1_9GLOM|nr:207_t:CDS:1 [Scutellospora calospora]